MLEIDRMDAVLGHGPYSSKARHPGQSKNVVCPEKMRRLTLIGCSHVCGLFAQHLAAGLDEVRGSDP
jgi:hypothetical protein